MRRYQPASYHYGFRQLASEESCNKEVWSQWEGELKHIADHLTHRSITAKKPKSSCHLKLYRRLHTGDGNNNDKKNNSFHNQGKNGAFLIHFLPSSGAFYRAPERLATVLSFSFLNWLRSLTQWVCATGQEKKEDGKTFVCDKRDRAIPCVFFSDLHLN